MARRNQTSFKDSSKSQSKRRSELIVRPIEYVDYAKVRDLLLSAQERRHELSYEQQMKLCSTPSGQRVRNAVESKRTQRYSESLSEALRSNDKLADHPDVCAKIAELMPMSVQSMRVIIASKRIAMDTSEIEEIIDTVRQHVLDHSHRAIHQLNTYPATRGRAMREKKRMSRSTMN